MLGLRPRPRRFQGMAGQMNDVGKQPCSLGIAFGRACRGRFLRAKTRHSPTRAASSRNSGAESHPFICPAMPFLGLSNSAAGELTHLHIQTVSGRFFAPKRKNGIRPTTGPQGWLSTHVIFSIEPRGCGSSQGVTRTFFLGCTARRRPSNWLPRRFYRVRLPRPLETQKGVPCGRTGIAEGGRTAPARLVEKTTWLFSFFA